MSYCEHLKDDYTCEYTREYVYDKPVYDLYCSGCRECWWNCPIYQRYKNW